MQDKSEEKPVHTNITEISKKIQ